MSDSKEPRVAPHRKPPAAAFPSRPAGTAATGRFERAVGARETARSSSGRHSAITRNLRNYASYKSWVEKMRSSWEPGKDPET